MAFTFKRLISHQWIHPQLLLFLTASYVVQLHLNEPIQVELHNQGQMTLTTSTALHLAQLPEDRGLAL